MRPPDAETPARGGLAGRADRAAGGLAADIALYALCAAFAGITALTAALPPHKAWGQVAVWGYAAATVLAVGQLIARRTGQFNRFSGTGARAVLTVTVFVVTALVPLLAQAVARADGRTDRAQDEVLVIEAGGERLWHTGTPYLGHDAIQALPKPEWLGAYLPYQPGMALFGLPRAIAGVAWWTDARVFFALVLIGTLVLTVRLIRRPGPGAGDRVADDRVADSRVADGRDSDDRDARLVRAVQSATVLALCALTIATGGDDLPVLGLCLLALAYAGAGRFGTAGVVVGIAGALKLFAWPVAPVLIAYAWATGGRRTALRCAAGSIGLPVAALVPAFVADRGAAIENVIRFPLGHGLVQSPAASPFPGHLIATYAPGGGAIATGLLVIAALAIGAWLVVRPPRSAGAAALVCAAGLLAAILLISATRFGYLLYPVAFACFAPALGWGRARSAGVAGSGAGVVVVHGNAG